jgi:shingomyelin synthase
MVHGYYVQFLALVLGMLVHKFIGNRLGICFGFLWVCSWVNSFATSIAWYRHPKIDVLPDLFFDVFESIDTLFGIPVHRCIDFILSSMNIGTITFIILQKNRAVIARRLMAIYGILLFLRGCTVLLTSLPDPYPMCRELAPGTQALMSLDPYTIVDNALLMYGPNDKRHSMTCGDMIFSGHSVLFVLSALVWHRYYPERKFINPVKSCVSILSALGCTLLIAARVHYTIDVVVAVYLTITIWASYHRFAKEIESGQPFRQEVMIDGLLLYPAIAWVETGKPFLSFVSLS